MSVLLALTAAAGLLAWGPIPKLLAWASIPTVRTFMRFGEPLAWIPFLNPVRLPAGARLWTLLPLVLCIALVYRATRARAARELPRPTVFTFVNIVLGMIAIAVGFYLVHQAVVHLV